MYSQIDNEETEYVFPSVGLCRCYCYDTVPLTETNIIGVCVKTTLILFDCTGAGTDGVSALVRNLFGHLDH